MSYNAVCVFIALVALAAMTLYLILRWAGRKLR